MAAGEIQYFDVLTGYDTTNGHYITGKILLNYNSAYCLHDDSVRVYYTTNPSDSGEPHKDLVPPDSTATGDNILKADSWQIPYTSAVNASTQSLNPFFGANAPKVKGLTNDMHIITFTIGGLNADTTYYTRAWLRLYATTTSTKVKMRYKWPDIPNVRFIVRTLPSSYEYDKVRPLLRLPNYITAPNDTYAIDWINFTDCIKLGTYNVNSEDVSEDWEDANYKTHRVVARKKITGKFEMIFPSIERFKTFMNLLETSKELNGDGIAYVDLEVHVNNVLDVIKSGETAAETPCINYIGKFFIKIDNNAWVQPIYGHYDKYSPLSITITEA